VVILSWYLSAICLFNGFLIFASGSARWQILGAHNEMFDLVLVPTDLKEATRQMTIYDLDDHGMLDAMELATMLAKFDDRGRPQRRWKAGSG
jgi:hypothetical protein